MTTRFPSSTSSTPNIHDLQGTVMPDFPTLSGVLESVHGFQAKLAFLRSLCRASGPEMEGFCQIVEGILDDMELAANDLDVIVEQMADSQA